MVDMADGSDVQMRLVPFEGLLTASSGRAGGTSPPRARRAQPSTLREIKVCV